MDLQMGKKVTAPKNLPRFQAALKICAQLLLNQHFFYKIFVMPS